MAYREYTPHPALRNYLSCLWTAAVPALALPHRHRVLPDNGIDILFQDDGAAGFAVGMMSRPIDVLSHTAIRTVAVRFRPGAATALLGLPLQLLQDGHAGIDLLWGAAEARRLGDLLWERDLPERRRLALLERELLARLRGQTAAAPGVAAAALALLDADPGLRIEALARRLGVSRQHLALRFREQVGLAPKLYARIGRFRRASAVLHAPLPGGAAPDWATLALDCGYFDQSHMIHDFQAFSGRAPQAWLDGR